MHRCTIFLLCLAGAVGTSTTASAQSGQALADDQKARNRSSVSTRDLEGAARRASTGDPSAVLAFFPLSEDQDRFGAAAMVTRALAMVAAGRRAEAVADCARAEARMAENRRELLDPTLCIALSGAYADLGNTVAQVNILRRALQQHPKDDHLLNALSWELATSLNGRVRNGPEAVTVGASACERTRWKDPVVLDTYAAALAEAGRWQEAQRWQTEVLALIGNNSPKFTKEAKQRLAFYQSRRPFRETTGPAERSRQFLRHRKFSFAANYGGH